MPLIKCPNCGHNVSDKAERCPHCGESIIGSTMNAILQESRQPTQALPYSNNSNTENDSVPPQQIPPSTTNNKKILLIIIISIFLISGISGCAFYMHNKYVKEMIAIETEISHQADSLTKVQSVTFLKTKQDSIYQADLISQKRILQFKADSLLSVANGRWNSIISDYNTKGMDSYESSNETIGIIAQELYFCSTLYKKIGRTRKANETTNKYQQYYNEFVSMYGETPCDFD